MTGNYTFSQLQKNTKKDMADMPVLRLALLGDCATQHLGVALKGYAYTCNVNLEIFEADYDQILQQVMTGDSETYSFKPDAVLLFMCAERLYDAWCKTPSSERSSFAETLSERITGYWNYISSYSSAVVLQYTFAENDDNVFGNYACKHCNSYIYQLRRLNMLLMEAASKKPGVFLIDLCGLQARLGRDILHSPKLYYLAKMPVSPDVLPQVAALALDTLLAQRGNIKKCAVLDLDNTLWGGVIGDDGLSGIEIGELGTGRAFSALQTWLKELKQRGIILAVCSKNEETTAKEPFEKHSEMILKLDDFAVFTANWEDKAANIRHIRETLNIGFDSMVFIDDNPFERNLVRSLIPDITVPELPDDPASYLTYLKSLNLFETASYSAEDAERTEQYQAEARREAMRREFETYDQYLQSLEMSATAAPFDTLNAPRIAQLTQRSNQFNLRTIRYTQAQIEDIMNDPGKITLYFTLKDKLTDYGLISVVILEKRSDNTLFADTWLMSCRVLRRGMEEFIINKVIDTAKENGYNTVTGEYIATQKNMMVADIYEKLGFDRSGKYTFTADVNNFKYNKTYINERVNK